MNIKKSLPLPKYYNSELAYWVMRLAGWQLSKNNKMRIIEAVKGAKK